MSKHRMTEDVISLFNSTSNSLNSHAFCKNDRDIILDKNDFIEDIQLESFVKSSVKVKIKINKVEKIPITL